MKNVKKGIAWMLVCVMLMGLVPISVYSAVEGTAESITAEEVTEVDAEDVDKTEVTTEVEEPGTTEIVVATESTTEVESDSESAPSVEMTTEVVSEEAVSVETVEKAAEKTTDVSERETQKVKTAANDKLVALEAEIKPMAEDEHNLTIDSSEIFINDVVHSEQNKNIKDKDRITIELEWSLPNTNTTIKPGDLCVYDLDITGIELNNVTSSSPGSVTDSSGNVVGKYYIVDDILYMYFDNSEAGQEFLKNSDRSGTLALKGTVKIDEIPLDENGDGNIKVVGDDYNIHVGADDRPVEIGVNKDAHSLVFDETMGLMKCSFTITVTAVKDTTNVTIEDWNESKNILIDEDTLSGLENISWDEVEYDTRQGVRKFGAGFSGKILSVEAGSPIQITYDAYLKKELYSGENTEWVSDINNVKATDRNDNDITNQARVDVQAPSVDKDGEYHAEDGTITWTITINNPNGIDLEDTIVTDELLNETKDYDLSDSSGTVEVSNGDSLTISEFLTNGYTFPTGSTETKYTITYTVKVSDEAIDSYEDNKTISNKADIYVPGYEVKDGDTATEEVGRDNPLQEKTGKWLEKGSTVEWSSTIEIPENGLSGVVYQDWFDDTMELDAGSVSVLGPDSQAPYTGSYTVTSEFTKRYNGKEYTKGFIIRFNNALSKGIYTITYQTEVNEGVTATEFWNYANLLIGESETGTKLASVNTQKILTKSGQSMWAVDGDRDVITWTLTLPADEETLSEISGDCTIEDTLPVDCAYVEGSAWANYDGLQVTQETGKVIFGIKDVIEAAKTKLASEGNADDIRITYETKITDMDTFLGTTDWPGVEYKNIAKLKKGNTVIDDIDATATAKSGSVIEKDVVYSEVTAPEARYTIEVNKNGYDLKDGDTLTITDTLPDNFELKMDTIKVFAETTGEWGQPVMTQITIPQPSYEGHTLTLQVPDGKHVQIQYSVIVNMEVGTPLFPSNSTNEVAAAGVTKGDASVALSSKQSFVVQGNATAGSISRSLTINKLAAGTDNLLADAKFQVKMMKLDENTGTLVDATEADAPGYELVKTFSTNEKGTFTVSGMLYDIVYEVSEETPPPGYQKEDTKWYYVYISQTKVSDYANLSQDIKICSGPESRNVENKPLEDTVFFSKQTVGGEELSGATITLYDTNGNVVTSWVSGTSAKSFKVGDVTLRDANGNMTQLAAGTYTMRETRAPDGYAYAEDITFTVDINGKITMAGQNGEVVQDGTKLIMRDKAIGYIYISKKAIGGNDELPGAHIVLKERESGKVVAEWTSGSEAYKIAGTLFKAGMEYVLTETIAPDGYEVTEKIIFKIDRNGTLSLSADNTNKDAEVTAYNGSAENNQIIMRDAVSETTEEKTTEEKTTEEKTTEEKTTEEKKTTTSKKTGDKMPIVGMAMLCGMSVAGYYVLQRKKKQKK